ncbi:MAG: protein kinase [Archangiaceae bacterium]|nr:protein kinase [Archangiaceae bacterium]
MPIETYGNYQLVEKLAIGGMAQLFLAKRLKPRGQERTVVLKRILPHLAEDTAFVTMFLDEARIAARLHHPNVVEILDLGAEGDSYFIAMEYIHGEDLRRIGKRGIELQRRMPPPLVCRVVAQACRGLDYAHWRTDAQGKPLRIVHRDVSPQNILVGFDGQVKVVDFGIAKAVDKATVTASGVIKGKHAYMSPEQALGRDIDHRTDVFALGIVLYETLTGTRLFRRATDLQTLKAVSECKVEAPSRVFGGVPASLDAIILKALSKDLTVRYQRADQLAAALEEWLGDRPDGSAQALGRYLSELFADRLDQEQREGKFVPTKSAVGIAAATRPPKPSSNAATTSLKVEKKTLTSHADRPPGEAESPLENRVTDITPAYRPGDLAGVGAPSRSPKPSKPKLQRLAEPVDPPTLPPTAVPAGAVTQTQLYGALPPEPPTAIDPQQQPTLIQQQQAEPLRVARPVAPDAPPAPAERITQASSRFDAPDDERPRVTQPARRPTLAWPWWVAAALVAGVLGAALTKLFVDRQVAAVSPVAAARPPAPAPVPAPAPDTAEPAALKVAMKPFNAVPVTGPVFALTRRQGQLFASLSGARLEAGVALRVVGPARSGSNARDFYGVASVVEVKESEARVLYEDPDALPDGLFVTREQ